MFKKILAVEKYVRKYVHKLLTWEWQPTLLEEVDHSITRHAHNHSILAWAQVGYARFEIPARNITPDVLLLAPFQELQIPYIQAIGYIEG